MIKVSVTIVGTRLNMSGQRITDETKKHLAQRWDARVLREVALTNAQKQARQDAYNLQSGTLINANIDVVTLAEMAEARKRTEQRIQQMVDAKVARIVTLDRRRVKE